MSDVDITNAPEDIAVVGMAGRFPGARDVEEFWRNLCEGRDSISRFSDEEVAGSGVSREMLSSPDYVKAGGVVEGVDLFDAPFFGLTPREAEIMDPQQRVFLECAWGALENAALDPETYPGRIGVYAGSGMNGYLLNIYSNAHLLETVSTFQALIGNEKDHLATLASYKLNLKGPAVSVQTTCSTSLVAVNLACQSLLWYQCDAALAGGVSIRVPQKTGYLYKEGGITSPDGLCRTFDAGAKGIVGGDGVGVVVLKRLADALADGDFIHAVIKGSAINNDGSAKAAYTAPGVDGQAEVIAEALAAARVEPETVTYVEAHGTGTALGDPIEVAALTQAFRAATEKKGFCAIGSVKTNIGHLNTAAGVAGLIKTTLALRHRRLPPTLHFERPNPKIDFASSPFYVNTRLTEWAAGDAPRRAAVSSFGIGGTNAHVVLEESPPREPSAPGRPHQLLVLSARTEPALEAATANLAEYLKGHRDDINLADVAYTLQAGRRSFGHRRVLVCADADDAVAGLEAPESARVLTGEAGSRERPVVMMFPGQGAQRAGMARELYRDEKTFREQVDLCSEMLLPELKFDLRGVMYGEAAGAGEGAPSLDDTAAAQPALFVTEYALAQLWMSWGVRPEATIGHSLGEYVSACLAGVMSLEDALSLVAARGRLMQQLPGGAMLAVPLGEEDARAAFGEDEGLSLAAVNGPAQCVISGPSEAVERLAERLAARDVHTRRLRTSHAFHSAMMEPMMGEFLRRVERVKLSPPQIPFVSNVTGTWVTDAEATSPQYWATHLRQPVRFAEGVSELLKRPGRVFLEVGPGRALGAAVRQAQGAAAEPAPIPTLPQRREEGSDTEFVLGALGRVWLAGAQVDWEGFNGGKRSRVPLPTYPFERRRYWVERTLDAAWGQAASADARRGADDWFYAPVWAQSPGKQLPNAARPGDGSRALLFVDECGLGAALARRLEELGHEVLTAAAGEEFAQAGERSYVINPGRLEDYARLLGELQPQQETPLKVFHLWGVTPDAEDPRAAGEFSASRQLLGFDSLLLLARALGAQAPARRFEVGVVTNNLHNVTGDEALDPQKATVLGACRAIPQELPNVECRAVDVSLAGPGGRAARRLVEQLVGEFATKQAGAVVAYRGSHRWVRRFEPVRLDQAATADTRLREGGVYLLTGGLSGIGRALAEHLARAAKARLIISDSSSLPRRDEWDAWLAAADERDEVSLKIRGVRALEEMGAEVMLLSASPGGAEELKAALSEARERFGALHGVLHTEVGTASDFIQSRARAEEPNAGVLSANVKGALLLGQLLKDERPDFVALFSSAVSVTGGLGQAEYCATSAFLDAFAHYNSSVFGHPTTAVDWDVAAWEQWPEQLLSVVPEWETRLRRERETYGLSPDDGVAAFERLLAAGLTQAVVSARDFAGVPARAEALGGVPLSERLKAAFGVKTLGARGGRAADYVAPANQVERTIAEVWREVLGVERVGARDNFFDLGGNSLLGIQLMSRLRKVFLLELPMNILFELPTVAEQASVVSETQRKEQEAEELDRLLKEIEGLSADDIEAKLALSEGPSGQGVR
jgi:acyl transferase domain-containing protein